MKKYLLIFLFCLSCAVASEDIKALLVEKKEPANAVCYLKLDPWIKQKTLEVPYSDVSFLFSDTPISEKMPNIWIQFEDKKVLHIFFGDKKVKVDVFKKEFIEKILKLKTQLEARIA